MQEKIDFSVIWTWIANNNDPISAIGSIATTIAVIILVITLGINHKQLKKQEEENTVTNYLAVFQQLDYPLSKSSRRALYQGRQYLKKLVENYKQKENDKSLDAMNEISKYIAGLYDSIYVITKDNKALEKKLISHHGFTIGRLWKILQPLHQTWKNHDLSQDYVGFKTLGNKSYYAHKYDIDKFYEENYMKNSLFDDEFVVSIRTKILGLD